MATVDVTQENFEQVVGGHDIVIVDFSAAVPDAALPPPSLESWAPWRGPCRGFAASAALSFGSIMEVKEILKLT